MKRSFKSLIAVFLLALTVLCAAILSGCSYAGAYTYTEGITITFFSEKEARIEVAYKPVSAETSTRAYEVVYNAVHDYFVVEQTELPQQMDNGYTLASFDVTSSSWSLSVSAAVDESFLFAAVDIAYANPFAVQSSFKATLDSLSGAYLSNYIQSDLSSFVAVLIPEGRHSISGANSVRKDYIGYAQWVLVTDGTFSDTLSYSYNAMVSAGWFAIAVMGGLIAVALVLWRAKKKSGEMVAVKPVNNPAQFNQFNNPANSANSFNANNPNNSFSAGNNSEPKKDVFEDYPD